MLHGICECAGKDGKSIFYAMIILFAFSSAFAAAVVVRSPGLLWARNKQTANPEN